MLVYNPEGHKSVFVSMVEPVMRIFGENSFIAMGFLSFLLMIVMGFVIGGLIGYFASRSLVYIQKSHLLEITLTLVIAHATFLFTEWINEIIVPASPVIATTIAAIVMGNYGRYKMSAETRHTMGEYWEFFAFIANSLVFLLVGVMIVNLNVSFSELWLPIILSILAVAISRAISVYAILIPLNKAKKEFQIPLSWMHLLSWGSLRGGLAIIMALFIPANFSPEWWTLETSVRDFVLALVVGCIIFTTFVKATTIPKMLKILKITAPSSIETMDYAQGRILFLLKLLAKIESATSHGYTSEEQRQKIAAKYQKELDKAHADFFAKIKNNDELEMILERTLSLHALEIEKSILVYLFNHHEIPEWILRRMLNKLDSQIERVEDGCTQLKEAYEHKTEKDILQKIIEKFVGMFGQKRDIDEEKYYKSRTRTIILEKVIERFELFRSVEEIANSRAFDGVLKRYQGLLESAKNTRTELYKKPKIQHLEQKIVMEMLDIRKHDILDVLDSSGLISQKTKKSLAEKYITH